MLLSKPEITEMFRKAAQIWNENKDYLSEIDSRLGGGNHGVAIGEIAGLIERSLDGQDDDDMETFLEGLGDNAMEIERGSAGPLYGTIIGGLSGPLEESKPIDAGTLKEIFTECLSAMEDITNADVGDKTMVDALIPTMGAAQKTKDDVIAMLEAARRATARGTKENEQYASKYGRARSYKEKTADAPDADAMNTSLFSAGLCDGLKQTVTEVEDSGSGQ